MYKKNNRTNAGKNPAMQIFHIFSFVFPFLTFSFCVFVPLILNLFTLYLFLLFFLPSALKCAI
jgi:ABC-type multidrug transport system permease subunit